MNYELFEELLEQAKLSKKEFAKLVDMNYNSITNWNRNENIPSWVKSWLENYIKAKVSDEVIEAVKPFVK